MDIIVTTPKSQMANAAKEAADCLAAGGGFYFRRLPSYPYKLQLGDRVYYVENGKVWGFAAVSDLFRNEHESWTCQTTGITYPPGIFVVMLANSWRWIEPISMKGFQGWRYAPNEWRNIPTLGNWKDRRPILKIGHLSRKEIWICPQR